MKKKKDISAIRKRAWATRRKVYGAKGHCGSYTRQLRDCDRCSTLIALVIKLHSEGVLSEGQTVNATGLPRATVRKRVQELPTPTRKIGIG